MHDNKQTKVKQTLVVPNLAWGDFGNLQKKKRDIKK